MHGSCLCGAVKYESASPALVTAVCHCTHCQKTSGSAFSVNAIVPGAAFKVTGSLSTYTDRGESGGAVERCFCSVCGSPVASRLANGLVAVKVGTLESQEPTVPTLQVWTRSAKPWSKGCFAITGFETNPPAA